MICLHGRLFSMLYLQAHKILYWCINRPLENRVGWSGFFSSVVPFPVPFSQVQRHPKMKELSRNDHDCNFPGWRAIICVCMCRRTFVWRHFVFFLPYSRTSVIQPSVIQISLLPGHNVAVYSLQCLILIHFHLKSCTKQKQSGYISALFHYHINFING